MNKFLAVIVLVSASLFGAATVSQAQTVRVSTHSNHVHVALRHNGVRMTDRDWCDIPCTS